MQRPAPAPDDADHAIADGRSHLPFLDAHGHGRQIDARRSEVPGAIRYAALVRALRELAHVAGGTDAVVHQLDRLDPLDAGAPVPAGHDQPDREAVVARQRRPVHARGEKRAGRAQLLQREDPARARLPGAALATRVDVEAPDEDPRRFRPDRDVPQHVVEPNAAPLRRAHETERSAVARALEEMRAHRLRPCGEAGRRQRRRLPPDRPSDFPRGGRAGRCTGLAAERSIMEIDVRW